jgi:Glyoxalase/Bleomycin resistance protein/Dioxygenase superfamily
MGGVRWMFHTTAIGPSYDALLHPLARLFGCRPLHLDDSDDPAVGRRGGMTWIGDGSIELGEPLGDASPLWSFLQRFGGGMHSFGVQVEDVPAALERAARLGVEPAAFVQPNIAFTRPSTTAGLSIEWASHVQDDDPRWGGPIPAFTVEPVVDVPRLAFVAAVTNDPVADAERLASVLDTDLAVLDDHRRPDRPWATVALGDCALALYPLVADVWGQPVDRPRCIAMGLQVEDLGDSERRLAAVEVRASAHPDDGTAVLLPPAVPFPIVLVDRLLPGDPRSAR